MVGTELRKYQDLKEDDPKWRVEQAGEDLARVLKSVPANILEVGPGVGGVTVALRNLRPDINIVAIDWDTDPAIADAAERNGALFLQRDITGFSPDALHGLLTTHSINTILALRTSARAAAYLTNVTEQFPGKKLSRDGLLVFSLIDPSDVKEMNGYFQNLVRNNQLSRQILHVSRSYTEVTYQKNW